MSDPIVPPILAKYPDLVMKMRIEIIRARRKSGCKSACNASAIMDKYISIAKKRFEAFGKKK